MALELQYRRYMPPISRILAPIDFSDRCLGMLPYVRAIAERYKSEVILLHVVNPVYTIPETGISGPVFVPVPQWVFAEKTKELERFAISELRGLSVRRLVYEGDPETQITTFSKEEDVQLIVIPTHGYGVLRRYLIGSVTAKILHDVSCPVLTGVHMEGQEPMKSVKLSNIVCAVDLSPSSADTLAWASRLAKDFEAKLMLVHVIPPINPGLYVTFTSRLKEEWEDTVRKDVEKLQTEVGGTSVGISIPEGDVAREVCSFAHSMAADLLVIGRAPHDGRLRTNAYAIIRQSPCPVLSI
jgi:nucleotide-binding universal stress UspA family protein